MLTFPKPTKAEQLAEEVSRQEALTRYEQVQTQLRTGNLAEALQLVWHVGSPYRDAAVKAVAQAQVQAGDLLGAVATAQGLRYADTKGEVLADVTQVLLQRGDVVGTQWLAATVTGFGYVGMMKQIAEAQQRAGDTEAARRTLVQAQQRAQGFSEGDGKNGYFRSYYLGDIVEAQLRLGDVAGATYTAQLIDRPEDQSRALRLIGELATSAADPARRDAGPA